MYNLRYAVLAKQYTGKPVISVGGFRSLGEIDHAICREGIDFVSMSRPFIAEPAFVHLLRKDPGHISGCNNCNYCAILCDTEFQTQCHKNVKS